MIEIFVTTDQSRDKESEKEREWKETLAKGEAKLANIRRSNGTTS